MELVDIPPAELLERMRQGRVYRPEQAARALKGFFREGNLAALRELALRRTAERVDAEVSGYMRANAIAGPWPAGRPCHGAGRRRPGSRDGGAAGAPHSRRAAAPRSVALHVERPGAEDGADPAAALRLAEALGAEVETVVAADLPAAILALPGRAMSPTSSSAAAARRGGGDCRSLGSRPLLLRQATDFSLHLVPDPALRAAPCPRRPELPAWIRLADGPGLRRACDRGRVSPSTAWCRKARSAWSTSPPIVAAAVGCGPVHRRCWRALLSFLCWNFLFLPPRYDPDHRQRPGCGRRRRLQPGRPAAGRHHRRAWPLGPRRAGATVRPAATGGVLPPPRRAGRR